MDSSSVGAESETQCHACSPCKRPADRVGDVSSIDGSSELRGNVTVGAIIPTTPAFLTAADVSYLDYRLSQKNRFANETLRTQVIEEYTRFLMLIASDYQSGESSSAVPSKLVDDCWHAHILHTQRYASMCMMKFGGHFVHHVPAEHATHANHHENTQMKNDYANTIESYQRIFGMAPPAAIWPQAKVVATEAQ